MPFIKLHTEDSLPISAEEIKNYAERKRLFAVSEFDDGNLEEVLKSVIIDFETRHNFAVLNSEYDHISDSLDEDGKILLQKGNLRSINSVIYRGDRLKHTDYFLLRETDSSFGGLAFNRFLNPFTQGFVVKARFGFDDEKPLYPDLKVAFIYETLRSLVADVSECDDCFNLTPKSLDITYNKYKRFKSILW